MPEPFGTDVIAGEKFGAPRRRVDDVAVPNSTTDVAPGNANAMNRTPSPDATIIASGASGGRTRRRAPMIASAMTAYHRRCQLPEKKYPSASEYHGGW